MGILGPNIREIQRNRSGAAQRQQTRRGIDAADLWWCIVDSYVRAAASGSSILVSHSDTNGVVVSSCSRWIVVEVLMQSTEGPSTWRKIDRRVRGTIAPANKDYMIVRNAGICEHSTERGAAVFGNRS